MFPGGRFSSLLLAGSSVVLATLSTTHAFSGDGTVYHLGDPSGGNCNFMSYPSDATTKYAALNNAQWDDTMNCGRCAQVTCTDPQCSNAPQKSEVVYIVDQCPGCEAGDLDMSPDVFTAITGMKYTRLTIEWEFVDCPVEGPIEYCLKKGSNNFWTAIQPTNSAVGVESVLINNKPTTMVASAYYFLLNGNSDTTVDLSQLTITTTSIDGEVVEDVLDFSGADCVKSSSQFHGTSPAGQVASSPTPTASPTTASPTPSPTPSPTTAAPTPSPTPEPTPSPTPEATPTLAPIPEPSATTASTTSPTPAPSTETPAPSTPAPSTATPAPTSDSTPSPSLQETLPPRSTPELTTPTPSGNSTPQPSATAESSNATTVSDVESNSDEGNNIGDGSESDAGNLGSGSFDGSDSESSSREFDEAGISSSSDNSGEMNSGSNVGGAQKESTVTTQTQAATTGTTVVVSVLAVLGCLFLMVVFILVVLLKKRKLQQKMQQRKRDDHEAGFHYSSEEDYHANTAIDEQTAYSYIAATTPHQGSSTQTI
ncbi:hypothetical protein BBJ28_00024071 [Nothophytophthora sp. Chile5]|nr:hypothetical protein BBJ28_00024071 [Nothophytophthora sp. Chile5]